MVGKKNAFVVIKKMSQVNTTVNHHHTHRHANTKTDDTSSETKPIASAEETDPELSDLVESFQKLQKGMAHASSDQNGAAVNKHTFEYVTEEIENLKRKQSMIQEQIEAKNKEVHSLRETLLVVNGALQGLQHIHTFMVDKEKECSSYSTTMTTTTTMPAKTL
jgi:phage/plasmid primase-like uncharacterized protein